MDEDRSSAPSDASGDPSVIEIDHVSKSFGGHVAVDDVDLRIGEGEFFSLLGPSGCGKTTTLRMIAGFERPDRGAIRLGGVDVSRVPPNRRDINTVFQQYALFPHMDVFDNVAFGPRSRRVDRATVASRVEEILSVVRLSELAGRRPAQLSGGQQQRVALARALVNMPKALLLDEPLGALDLKLRHAMQFELKRIQREVGITFVYVTHDQEEALTMSDRIVVMSEGRVEQIGTPTEIYDSPRTVFVAGFIGQANLWPATIRSRASSQTSVDALGGADLEARCDESGLAVGDRAVLMVRPERITVQVTEPQGETPRVPATVTDLTFQGPVVRLAMTSRDGTPIVAALGPDADLPLLRPGDPVWATWSAHAGCVLPDTDHRSPTTDY